MNQKAIISSSDEANGGHLRRGHASCLVAALVVGLAGALVSWLRLLRLLGRVVARLLGCLAAWWLGCRVGWLLGCCAVCLPGCLGGCLIGVVVAATSTNPCETELPRSSTQGFSRLSFFLLRQQRPELKFLDEPSQREQGTLFLGLSVFD